MASAKLGPRGRRADGPMMTDHEIVKREEVLAERVDPLRALETEGKAKTKSAKTSGAEIRAVRR